MAPSYQPSKEDKDKDKSQLPSWAVSSRPAADVQPSFMLSQPGQQFGFRVASQLDTPTNGTPSSMTSTLQIHQDAALARQK